MRPPPPISDVVRFPVVGGTIVLALGVTLAAWSGKYNIDALVENADIRRGQLWRLLTSTLIHADILHLVFNLYWTWVFGTLIEAVFGHFKTFGIFVLLAIASSGAEYAILSGGVGLSGVGYGLFGLLWVLSRHDPRFEQVIDKQTITLFVAWFFICIVLTLTGSPIANVAHGVGALTGALLGWAIAGPRRQKQAALAGLVVLLAASMVGATIGRPYINVSKDRGEDEADRGYKALVAGRDQEAVRWLRDATHMQPRIAGNWSNLGIAYERLGEHAAAAAAFQRASQLEPNNPNFRPTDGKR